MIIINLLFMNYDRIYPNIKSYCIWSEIIEIEVEDMINFFNKESIMTDNLCEQFNSSALETIDIKIEEWEAVFPKINNKSAKDAEFIIPKMQCFSLEEVFILLKSSSLIGKEVKDSSINKKKIFLTLKKWYSINESNEFRLFIYDYKLKGISQRNTSTINTRDDLNIVRDLIVKFMIDIFNKKISSYSNLIIDVVVYTSSDKVKIIDITESNYDQNTLLFSYDEIKESKGLELLNFNKEEYQDLVPIRVLRDIEGLEQSKEEIELLKNKFPIELTEYSSCSIDKLIEESNVESSNNQEFN